MLLKQNTHTRSCSLPFDKKTCGICRLIHERQIHHMLREWALQACTSSKGLGGAVWMLISVVISSLILEVYRNTYQNETASEEGASWGYLTFYV